MALTIELGELAQLLPEINLDLDITGFEVGEIDQLKADLADPESDPADEPAEAADTSVSLRGEERQHCHDALEIMRKARVLKPQSP